LNKKGHIPFDSVVLAICHKRKSQSSDFNNIYVNEKFIIQTSTGFIRIWPSTGGPLPNTLSCRILRGTIQFSHPSVRVSTHILPFINLSTHSQSLIHQSKFLLTFSHPSIYLPTHTLSSINLVTHSHSPIHQHTYPLTFSHPSV